MIHEREVAPHNEPVETDVVLRVIVTKRLKGAVPVGKRHQIVKKLRRLFGNAAMGYTVDIAEVISVQTVNH